MKWADAVLWPTWDTLTQRVIVPAAVLWTAYQISGKYRSDSPAERDALSEQRNEITAAVVAGVFSVGIVGGTLIWWRKRKR